MSDMHDILGLRYHSICLANVGLGCIRRSDRPRLLSHSDERIISRNNMIGENKEETKRPAFIGKFHSNLQELMPMPCQVHAMQCGLSGGTHLISSPISTSIMPERVTGTRNMIKQD